MRHPPELDDAVERAQHGEDDSRFAQHGPRRFARGHRIAQRYQAPRRPPEKGPDDDRRRDDRDTDSADLGTEAPVDDRFDLPGLGAAGSLVHSGALRRPRREDEDVRRAEERRVTEGPEERRCARQRREYRC